MSLFNKIMSIFNNKTASVRSLMNQTNDFSFIESIARHKPSSSAELIASAVGIACIQQNRLGEIIGDANWQLDVDRQLLIIGNHKFTAGLIGTESHVSNTWRFGTVNSDSYPATFTEDILLFNQKSNFASFIDFNSKDIVLDELINGHNLSALVSAFFDRDCYYKTPYDNGAAYILIKSPPTQIFDSANCDEIVQAIKYVIQTYEGNHRVMVAPLIEKFSKHAEFSESAIRFTANDMTLDIKFDDQLRIDEISSTQS
ncbi:DUF6882 domain-containing protein [Thorsellia kenyensis]|uniref:DUF6882 domain-containing protein n=1 Tax=Thorsellia kenyensis TaxID=1549888 RepID=A0ABV6CBJ5_9GAMM